MLFADVVFVAMAPWFTSLIPMLLTLSPPEFFNSVIGMGKYFDLLFPKDVTFSPSLVSITAPYLSITTTTTLRGTIKRIFNTGWKFSWRQ